MIFRNSGKRIALGFLAISLLGLSLLIAVPVRAQVAGATLSGTLIDSSGGVVPHAHVSIKNLSTGIIRTATTNTSGFYSMPNLSPATYEVTASASGFVTIVQTGITLTVGAQQELSFTLKVGGRSEQIKVTGEPATVQLSSPDISATVESRTVVELPLDGRSWTDLATLQPGVVPVNSQDALALNNLRGVRGYGAEITISGGRPQQNTYRLNGININDNTNGAPGSVLGGNLGVDAVQEFSVLTSTPSAEYGRFSGGVINAVTRSGSNDFHGSAYEFVRNSALDARNFFDTTIPPFKRNQFGASAGGPIRRDRTFFFGDYEGIRQSLGVTAVDDVPSADARMGNLCSVPGTPPTCTPTTVAVDSSVQKYLPLYPMPNSGVTGNGDIGIFKFAGQQVTSENYFTGRIDHILSEKDSLFGSYSYDNAPFVGPDAFDDVLVSNRSKRQVVTLEENHSFSAKLFNSARFGFNRVRADNTETVKAINPLAGDPSLGAAPGLFAGQLNVPGLTFFAGGLGGVGIIQQRWNSFQGYDDAVLVLGRHSLKFGGAVERMQLNDFILNNPNGKWSFGTLQAFLTNNPKQLLAALRTADFVPTPRGLRETLFGLYVQDEWHLRSNVTVNLGLRYEPTTVLTEVQGKLSNLINLTDATAHLGDPFYLNPTLHNFQPRVGLAWDPFHDGKTSVRASFGMFDVLPLPYEFQQLGPQTQPFDLNGVAKNLPQGAFFSGGFSLLGVASLRQTFVQHDPHRNYVMQWNFNIQREVTPNLIATIGYVGSHGVHQPFRSDDPDIVLPTLTSAGYLWPSPIGSGTRINPSFGDIRAMFYGGSSLYDGLVVGLTKRISHGFQVQGSFTWDKSIDTGSSALVSDAFVNSISSLPWFNLKLNRGLSDFNVGRVLVINGIWQIPTSGSLSGIAARLANGWQLGAIFKANDGTPFTPTFGTDGDPLGLNSSDPWDVPNRLSGPGCGTLTNPGNPNNYIKTQCFAVPTAPSAAFYTANCDPTVGTAPQCFNLRGNAGRNIIVGPGLTNLDFSVFKNNHIRRISESFNLQFRVELFNLLNHPNFALPVVPTNTDIFDSTGAPNPAAGQLTSTSTSAREIQFAVKVLW